MPATDLQGSSSPFSSFGRSLFSLRRGADPATQVMDGPGSPATSSPGSGAGDTPSDLDAFQRLVAEAFQALLPSSGGGGEELLSAAWVRKLLDCYLVCHDHFSDAVLASPAAAAAMRRPPLDRAVAEFLDRSVKALDVCNAVRDGVEHVRQWRKHLEIVLAALSGGGGGHHNHRHHQQYRHGAAAVFLGEGQLRRARRALADLTIAMLDEKDAAGSAAAVAAAHRNRSFGRSTTGGSSSSSSGGKDHHLRSQFRSLSWSVSRSWSAARQLQAIAANLTPPRSSDILATNGLAVAVYTMSSVLLFVTWALVAAIPCQDRGLQVHFSVPKAYPWAAPLMSLHDRIAEEAKRKDRRNSSGLLREIHRVERCGRRLTELVEAAAQGPGPVRVGDDKEAELRREVEELQRVCEALRDGLDPVERGVREVFHRIVRSRVDGFDGCCAAPSN